MTDPVYLDNAATTPLDPRVLESMLRAPRRSVAATPLRCTPSGRSARDAVEGARASVAALDRGRARGDRVYQRRDRVRRARRPRTGQVGPPEKRHAVVSRVEHAAVREDAKRLQKEGFEVSWIGVDADGLDRPGRVRRGAAPRHGARGRDLGEQRGRHRRARARACRAMCREGHTVSRRRGPGRGQGPDRRLARRRSRRWPSRGTSSTARRASAPCTCAAASRPSPSSTAEARRRV